ncbi:MAG: hypothetical protein HZC42_00390 [Candidatus Eisenbacteria bacterium]|nr:hypothetical protein [Candidatus Eisenbacteria bacterium]
MSRRSFFAPLLALSLVLLLSAAARADGEVKAEAGKAVTAGGETRVARPPLTAEEKALLAVEEQNQAQVEALVKSMAGLPDGPALRALERKIEQVKREGQLQFLRVKVQFARQRGDLAAAHEAERMINLILNPPPATPGTVARPEPGKEGGRP